MQVIEIIILAMIAAFLGLRLYSVLGQRAEHEEESIPQRFEADDLGMPPALKQPAPALPPKHALQVDGIMPMVERSVSAIAAADPRFDIIAFLESAQGAYAI